MSVPVTRRHRASRLAAAIILAALLGALPGGGACGKKGDFPGKWVSVRGHHIVITARDDGDYDVTFVDSNPARGEDMTFPMKRSGNKLSFEADGGSFFYTLTLGGDRLTLEQVGGVENYLRED
jgi:hypothetical protein